MGIGSESASNYFQSKIVLGYSWSSFIGWKVVFPDTWWWGAILAVCLLQYQLSKQRLVDTCSRRLVCACLYCYTCRPEVSFCTDSAQMPTVSGSECMLNYRGSLLKVFLVDFLELVTLETFSGNSEQERQICGTSEICRASGHIQLILRASG